MDKINEVIALINSLDDGKANYCLAIQLRDECLRKLIATTQGADNSLLNQLSLPNY